MSSLGVSALRLAAVLASALAEDDACADLHRRAGLQLSAIERDVQSLRSEALSELVGKEYYHRSTDPRGPFYVHTAEQVESWFREPLEKAKQDAAGLEADYAALLKSDPKMTADRFYEETYGRIGEALGRLWELRRRVIGGRADAGGRFGMMSAVNERAYDARLKSWEAERGKLDRSSPEYPAKLAALQARLAAEETRSWADLAGPYRETTLRLRESRRKIAGDLWLWQDIAFRRGVVKDDVHAKAEGAFRARVYGGFAWRDRAGVMDRLADTTVLQFRQVTNFFNLDTEPRFGELRPADNVWCFSIRGFLNESADDLRRGDDQVPLLNATGSPLEQLIQKLHGRLKALRSLDERMELLAREMSKHGDLLEDRERLKDKLATFRAALEAYLAVALPARDEAGRYNDAEADLKRDEADFDAKTAALEKVRTEIAGLEKDLRVRPSGDVVRAADLGGKPGTPFAEAERKLKDKIATLRQNPDAPGAKDTVARLEDDLTKLRERRDAALEPARRRAGDLEKALAVAKTARDRSLEKFRKIPAPKDRGAELKDLHAAAAAARAEAVGGERPRAALPQGTSAPAELPAFTKEAALGSIVKACADGRTEVAALERSLETAIEGSREELGRELGDYQALGRYHEKLGHHTLVLRRDGAVAARTALEAAGGDPGRDPVFDELAKLVKKLERVLSAFNAVGTLYPERVDFLAEPGESKPVGLDELLRKTTDALGLVGRVLKQLKKGADTLLAVEELHRRLKNNDPEALVTALRLIGEEAGRVPVAGAVIGRFIGFYADSTEAALRAIKSLQKQRINEALSLRFDGEKFVPPEGRLYTVEDLKESVGNVLQNTEAASQELIRLALVFQSRRMMRLIGVGPRGDIGPRP